jgi:hypothetical protein
MEKTRKETRRETRKEIGLVYIERSMEVGISGISVNISYPHVD